MPISVMEEDGARNNWRGKVRGVSGLKADMIIADDPMAPVTEEQIESSKRFLEEVNKLAPSVYSDEDFKEPMLEKLTLQDHTRENLKAALASVRKENTELKWKMQDMRRSIFRPNQVQDDEELALLTNEKAQLEEKIAGLESMVTYLSAAAEGQKNTKQARTTSNEAFTTLVQKRIKQCTDILFVKNKEYSSKNDRLHNFKVAAQFLGSHPVQALKGMMVKDEVSLFDMCCAVIEGKQPPSYILMDEKFGDIHNYYFLLEALLEEYREERG